MPRRCRSPGRRAAAAVNGSGIPTPRKSPGARSSAGGAGRPRRLPRPAEAAREAPAAVTTGSKPCSWEPATPSVRAAKRPAAIFLRAAGSPRGILLDAGPGCHAALREHGLSVGDLAAVVLSHFHGDHFAGLPFLELDARRTGRSEPLVVFTPPGGRDRIAALRRCLYREKTGRFSAEIRETLPGETVSLPEAAGGGAAVPFPADHQPGAWAFGWKLRFGGRTIVYSGDTAFTDRLVRESGDADLLIQECTSLEALPGHTSHADLRRAAGRITARRVLLVHTGEDVLEARDLIFERAHDGLRAIV